MIKRLLRTVVFGCAILHAEEPPKPTQLTIEDVHAYLLAYFDKKELDEKAAQAQKMLDTQAEKLKAKCGNRPIVRDPRIGFQCGPQIPEAKTQ